MMLVSDMILAWDPAFRTHLEMYAEDPTEGELLAKVSLPPLRSPELLLVPQCVIMSSNVSS